MHPGLNNNLLIVMAIILLPAAFLFRILGELKYLSMKIDAIDDKFEKKISVIDDRISAMDEKFTKKIDDQTYILQHKLAIYYAEYSSGIVQIDPASEDNNAHACGTLITDNELYFFLTNAHVAFDSKKGQAREIRNITLYDGSFLNFSNSSIMFKNKNSPDIALIEVNPTPIQKTYAVIPSSKNNYLGQQLISVSLREIMPVFQKCDVVEIPEDNYIQTNCGGIHGSSGTGYLDEYGFLVAVHRGQGAVYDEIFDSQDQDEFGNNDELENMTSTEKQMYLLNIFRSYVTEELKDMLNLSNQTNETEIVDLVFNNMMETYNSSIKNMTNNHNFLRNITNISDSVYDPHKEILYFPINNNEKNTINSLSSLINEVVIMASEIVSKSITRRMLPRDIIKSDYPNLPKELAEKVRNTLVVEMKTYSRNPRAQAVPSKYIFELLKNETNNSIKLSFKEKYQLF